MNYIIICLMSITIISLIAYIVFKNNNIKKLTKDLGNFLDKKAAQTNVQLSLPDKDLEALAYEINQFIDDYFKDIYSQKLSQERIRKEITNISHDLRTPLTSIIGYVDLLEQCDISEDEMKEYLNIVSKKSKILESLIEDLYEYSRLEGNEIAVNYEKLDFNYMFNEHILSYYNEFESKGIELNINKSDKPLFIEADKKYFNRVLNNITSNTLKYAQNIVYIEITESANQIKIAYKNENHGLTSYDVKHIFDRFYMKDESRTKNSSGLGLTIAKILIEKMGGQMNAFIEDNQFVIEFTVLKCEN